MRKKPKRHQISRFKAIQCQCGKTLSILKPEFTKACHGMKSHTHCSTCKLEWHLTYDGKVYSHPWKRNERLNGLVHTTMTIDELAPLELERLQSYA